MANKAISELPQAQNVNNQDLFVLEQSGIAKKLPAETFITEQGIINALAEALDGHGGIQSVTLSSVSGRIRTYRITFTDQSATTFQVYDGTSIDRISRTSSSGLDDVYTIFLSDGTTTFFTVHNGADGTVSEAMLNDALKNKAPAVTETTESSAIANFTDGADDMPLHNILAEINPVQDLPYGDPYPAGSGKNLFGGSYNELFELHIPSGTTICAYCDTTATINYYGADGQTRIDYWTVSSAGRVFTLIADAYYFRFNGAEGATPTKMYIAIESAFSGYLPYSNICPITGWTGVNVTRTGANLWDEEWELVNNAVSTKNYVPVVPSANYYWKAPAQPSNGFNFYNKEKELINTVYSFSANNNIIEIPANCYFVKFKMGASSYGTTYNHDISINHPSTDHDYHAYQGSNTVTVDWQTEAGTVYGGTIDVATGLLTVTHQYLTDNGSLNWVRNNDGSFYVYNPSSAAVQDATGCCCNYAPFAISFDNLNVFFRANGLIQLGKGWGNVYESANDLKAAFASTPIQFVYKLATPQTYQLTPQEVIKTLLGTNNVWADTGDTTVTYPADTKMYIEKLTIPSEDDMVANQAITSGKYFMIGNSLYLALANIASGAQITIGTNAQRVSLADALNTINS